MDVERILVSVEERDRWMRRLGLLRSSLEEVRAKKRSAERRLKALRREIAQLARVTEAVFDPRRTPSVSPSFGTTTDGRFPRR